MGAGLQLNNSNHQNKIGVEGMPIEHNEGRQASNSLDKLQVYMFLVNINKFEYFNYCMPIYYLRIIE